MTAYEAQILELLSATAGTLTKDISEAIKVHGRVSSRASNSQRLAHMLRKMELRGLVKRMDDKTPICWVLKEQEK